MGSSMEAAWTSWKARAGALEGVGAWHKVEQAQIDAFADATFDHQYIHVDPVQAAARSPYKVPIAHGFLTLSLVPHLLASALERTPAESVRPTLAINYGLDRVRFPAPVKVGARIRARSELVSVERVAENTLQLKRKVTIEIEGEDKPGCVAETLARLVYA